MRFSEHTLFVNLGLVDVLFTFGTVQLYFLQCFESHYRTSLTLNRPHTLGEL